MIRFLQIQPQVKVSSFAALVTQLLERIRQEIFKYGKVEPSVNITKFARLSESMQDSRLSLKFYIQKNVFKNRNWCFRGRHLATMF